MARVKLMGIRKAFGATQVIHGVDCEIADGEFIVILGPSGCGKSTLLRIVAGLEMPTAGEVFIGDASMNEVEPKDRNIAMVFQNYALYPHMSVFENMAYGLKIRGMGKDEIAKRVDEAAKILELGALLQRKPKELSGGQRQRVAMGRAIVRSPQVFLFDEPLSNLDAKLRVQTRMEIQRLHKRLRTTSLYVTHDQVEAMTLADRIIVMNAGRVEQIGTPREIYDQPATGFVASFIGAPPMNLLAGTVGADGASVQLAGDVTARATVAASAGTAIKLGVRPEHLRLVAEGDGSMPFVVDLVETLGGEYLVHGRVGTQSIVVRTADAMLPTAGDSIRVAFAPEKAHAFSGPRDERIRR